VLVAAVVTGACAAGAGATGEDVTGTLEAAGEVGAAGGVSAREIATTLIHASIPTTSRMIIFSRSKGHGGV
jgi:hypothetical protein